MKSSLCWKHLSGCFISRIFSAPCFVLQLPFAFSPPLPCVQAPTHTRFIPSSHPVCCWYAVPLLCWMKIQSFSAPAQSLSHKTCICWSYLLCMISSLLTLLCLFFLSWAHPVDPFPMSMSGVFAVPQQSRLANGVKERGVEQGAWGSSPASPTSLANTLHWSWVRLKIRAWV